MTLIEAAKQAREAFEWNFNTDLDNIPACERWAKMLKENINALDKAIAKAEQQEPERDSDCKEDDGCPTEKAVLQRFWREAQRRVAPPKREWQGLTLEQKHQLNDALNLQGRFPIIEAIEAKLKEKNT